VESGQLPPPCNLDSSGRVSYRRAALFLGLNLPYGVDRTYYTFQLVLGRNYRPDSPQTYVALFFTGGKGGNKGVG
jgi:hypothetical protein